MKENHTFGVLHCKGEDAEKFLQGQLTADMATLTDTQGGLACYLNLKGRVVALMFVIKRPDGYWLVLSDEIVPVLLNKLKKFIVFSKASLVDISKQFSIEGKIGAPCTLPAYAVFHEGNSIVFTLSPAHGLTLTLTPSEVPAEPLRCEFIKAMFEAHIPWMGLAQSEHFLPHYINLVDLKAVSFDKGCFVGQEIVARMHYKGHLNKKLVLIDGAPDPKDEIVDSVTVNNHLYTLVSKI